MKPVIYNASYLLNEELMDFNLPLEIHVTRFLKNEYPQYILRQFYNFNNPSKSIINDSNYEFKKDVIKVFIDSNEPAVCYMKEKDEDIAEFANLYDLLLTSNTNILKTVPNSRLFLYGTTWLNKQYKDKTYLGEVEENFNGFDLLKTDSISFLKTNKSKSAIKTVPGYYLRETIWPIKEKINHAVKFYYSNVGQHESILGHDGPLPGDDKLNLFKSKFSIIIENSQEKNYFSEKLIDCLLTKTVPIYWGCPNIEKYFDTSGFILFNDADDLIHKINKIDLNTVYQNYQRSIDFNFKTAKKYALNYSKRVEKAIKEFINV